MGCGVGLDERVGTWTNARRYAAPMSPHPKTRKATILAGTITSLAVVSLWAASTFWWFARWPTSPTSPWAIVLGSGRVAFYDMTKSKYPMPPREYWYDELSDRPNMRWLPEFSLGEKNGIDLPSVAIPLWVLAIPLIAGTLLAWRRHRSLLRSEGADLCPFCKYSRIGLAPSAACPECGKPAGSTS